MKVLPLLIVIFISAFSSANRADTIPYEKQLEKGIEAFYKTDWNEAQTIFEELKEVDPDDSRAYFFDSMIPFWKYYFAGNSREVAQTFLQHSQKAIDVSHRQLQKNPDDTTMVLMLSGLYGYRSLVAANEKEYKTAVESGMTGFKYTRQLLSLDNDDPKALIGKGMFYYMVGSVPDGLKWVTNMIGFSGNIEEGFNALEQAASSESYVSNDAKMMLAYLYRREQKPERALTYLKDLSAKYPENIIFQYNLAQTYEETNQPDEARKKYEQILTLESGELETLKDKSRNRLGNL